MAKKTIDPKTRARWAQEERQFREYVERRLAREREQFEARKRRRRILRRLSLGLLGRQ
ncbi:MAG TPA: hypothetical protein VE644_04415 [Gaiellaceae bacterium]|nr:hypothetical protein [Gaiellaceae bacterium]